MRGASTIRPQAVAIDGTLIPTGSPHSRPPYVAKHSKHGMSTVGASIPDGISGPATRPGPICRFVRRH